MLQPQALRPELADVLNLQSVLSSPPPPRVMPLYDTEIPPPTGNAFLQASVVLSFAGAILVVLIHILSRCCAGCLVSHRHPL